ncbi:hypothetical protein [Candidatus Nanohalobium constans]|uniref:Uncharacterized protein n=1 Tax=Candidatus Nanohalobium constans TaxID=2565781 RepID=A0A5Q0UFR6_9ARCH|nr:hypothetical protein [Candidatus Nanohalobium constans]QGA80384.1 hypothetical protein LC1Nh_0484 [Candidatus Nanohalobium constans]
MLNNKILVLTLITGLLAVPAAADLEFRDPDPVQFYTDIQLNDGTTIEGLPNPGSTSAPMTKGYADSTYLNKEGDTLNGRLNAKSNNITGLPTPQSNSDAAPKNYVDNQLNGISGSQNLSQILNEGNKANTTINMGTNKITNLKNPENSRDAANLNWTQNNFVRANGDSINGSIDLLGTNNIIAPDQIMTGGQNIQIIDTNNNQDILRLKEGGNVEIPNGNLDLNGNQLVNPSRIEYMDNDGDGNSWIGREYSTDGSFRFYDDTNVNLIMRQNGNMEIPNGKLTVNNPGNGDIIDASAANAKFLVTEESTSTYWATHNITDNGYNIGTNSGSRNIKLQPGETNTLTAKPGGNIEIPNGDLDITQSSSTPLTLESTESSNNVNIRFQRNSNDLYNLGYSNNKNGLSIFNFNTGNDEIIIPDSGGVEVPNGNLDIASPGVSGTALDVGGNMRLNSGAYIDLGGTNWRIEDQTGSNNRLVIHDKVGTNEHLMYLNNGGSIEIPNGNLDLNKNEIKNAVLDKRDCSSNGPSTTGQIVYCTNLD